MIKDKLSVKENQKITPEKINCEHEDVYLRSSGIWKCRNKKCGKLFY